MIEILVWGNPRKELDRLNIKAQCTWIGLDRHSDEMRIYEVSDADHQVMCDEPETDKTWTDCCWRSAKGSNKGNVTVRYKIAGHYIKAWDGEGRKEALEEVNGNTKSDDYYFDKREYVDIFYYLNEEIGAGQPSNMCALLTDLAKQNGIKMSQLLAKYQPL